MAGRWTELSGRSVGQIGRTGHCVRVDGMQKTRLSDFLG